MQAGTHKELTPLPSTSQPEIVPGLQTNNNLGGTTPVVKCEPTIGEWMKTNFDGSEGRLDELSTFPALPIFITRRDRTQYRHDLERVWRQIEAANDTGIAITGLATAVIAIRRQRIELALPKRRTLPYTPRHAR